MSIPINEIPCSAKIPFKSSTYDRGIYNDNLKWPRGSVGEITISFDNTGSYSILGSDSTGVTPSMNFAWLDPPLGSFTMDGYTFDFNTKSEFRNGCSSSANSSCTVGRQVEFTNGDPALCVADGIYCNPEFVPGSVVLHEFGHALGLYHEHQNALNGVPIEYDLDGATLFSLTQMSTSLCIEDYCKKMCYPNDVRPSFCSSECDSSIVPSSECSVDWEEAVDYAKNNVIDLYSCSDGQNCDYKGSDFDPYSVMIYNVADYMIKPDENGVRYNPTRKNFVYSDTDKAVLSEMYPKDITDKPRLIVRFIGGEEWERYWVKKVVVEQLSPIVGIDFVFDLDADVTDTTEFIDIFKPSGASSTTQEGVSVLNFFKDNIYLVIIVSVIVLIIIIYLVI